jgi:hypothetical protein
VSRRTGEYGLEGRDVGSYHLDGASKIGSEFDEGGEIFFQKG